MLVKICGVCRPEDAAVAAEAGADYVGVILSAVGPRRQDADAAARIWAGAPGVRRAGVVVDEPPERMLALAERLALDVLQLHGGESPSALEALRRPGGPELWKVLRVREAADVPEAVAAYGAVADALLLDTWSAGGQGGTGVRFDWGDVARVLTGPGRRPRIFVAGGLDAGNVARAIRTLEPDGVDVSSGVEASVGRKSADAVRAFVAAARAMQMGENGNEERRGAARERNRNVE